MKLSDFFSIRLHFVVAVLALPAGCGTANIVGERLRDDIAINGSDEEWRGRAQFRDNKKDLAIRVLNDEDSVYLCFSTSDRELVKKLGATGLTVWFDPKGGEKKSYGVRLPPEKRPRRFPFPKDGEPPVENRGHEVDSMPFKPSEKVEILFAGDPNPVRMDAVEAGKAGVEFGAKFAGGKAVYEFKIQIFGKGSCFEMGPVETLGIGFETGGRGASGGRRGGGFPGRGPALTDREMPADRFGPGGGRRGGFGGKGPRGKKGVEPFMIWLKVKLAA
jgi:hypothetical protein